MINIYINTECKHINNNTGIEEKGRGEGGREALKTRVLVELLYSLQQFERWGLNHRHESWDTTKDAITIYHWAIN